MKNAIIVFGTPEIPTALALYSQIDDAEIWVFDPHLLDNLSAAGEINCRYVHCDLGIDIQSYHKTFEIQALSIQKRIELEFEQSVPEAVGCHWQYHNIFYQLLTINSHILLCDKLLQLPHDVKFHILINDVPLKYYLPSFWPAILLLERLNSLHIPFTAYSYNRRDDSPEYIPTGDNFSSSSGPYQAFTYLPTSYSDYLFFEEEINAAGAKVLNFPSMNWNIPFQTFLTVGFCPVDEVFATLPLALQEAISKTTASVSIILAQLFLTYVRTEEYVIRQANYLAKQYEAQMIFYVSLDREFSSSPPKKLIMSNHEAGFQGPLTSFARKYNVPVVLLPHSKIFNFPVTSSYANTIALTHPLQGGAIVNLYGKSIDTHLISFPERQSNLTRPVASLKKVGIILNKFSCDGYTAIDSVGYAQGLKKLLSWCESYGIHCKPRLRPGHTSIIWSAAEIGFDASELAMNAQGSISDFAQDCEMCLMYDCPTSGAIELLGMAMPTINTVFRPLCSSESSITSSKIIPRESVEETLKRLDFYRLNPNELFMFRNRQFALYTASFGDSRPLRMFL
jgi:hypothetical protein